MPPFFKQVGRWIKFYYSSSIQHHYPVEVGEGKDMVTRQAYSIEQPVEEGRYPQGACLCREWNQCQDGGSPGAVHDAVQAVGNGEDSAVRKLLADGGLNQIVCLQVNGCCGLIED